MKPLAFLAVLVTLTTEAARVAPSHRRDPAAFQEGAQHRLKRENDALWYQAPVPPQLQQASSAASKAVNRHAGGVNDTLVVDDMATVFSSGALPPRLKDTDIPPPLDLNRAKLMARLTSAAYCSDKHVIESWTCTRCKRVPNFKPYKASPYAHTHTHTHTHTRTHACTGGF